MLPLWTEPERLVLGENSLTLHRRGKLHSQPLPFERQEHIDFDALAASLPLQMQKLAGRKLTIILANCWARYLIVPWQEHIYSHRDWEALAQNKMRERYGAKAADWRIQISLQGFGQPALAVAVDTQLAEGLDRLADQYRWQVQAIEPAFAAVVNHNPRHWRGDSWLLMVEHNRLLLAESKSGVWQRFSTMLSSPDMLEQHAVMLVQQARQFNPESQKQRLFLSRSGKLPDQDFIKDIDIRLLPTDWLSSEGGQ